MQIENLLVDQYFFFYTQYEDPVQDHEWNLYEEIFTDDVRKIYNSLSQIKNKKNKKNLLANTLNLVSKKSINKNALHSMVQSRNSSPQRILVSSRNSSPSENLSSPKKQRKKTYKRKKKNKVL